MAPLFRFTRNHTLPTNETTPIVSVFSRLRVCHEDIIAVTAVAAASAAGVAASLDA